MPDWRYAIDCIRFCRSQDRVRFLLDPVQMDWVFGVAKGLARSGQQHELRRLVREFDREAGYVGLAIRWPASG